MVHRIQRLALQAWKKARAQNTGQIWKKETVLKEWERLLGIFWTAPPSVGHISTGIVTGLHGGTEIDTIRIWDEGLLKTIGRVAESNLNCLKMYYSGIGYYCLITVRPLDQNLSSEQGLFQNKTTLASEGFAVHSKWREKLILIRSRDDTKICMSVFGGRVGGEHHSF